MFDRSMLSVAEIVGMEGVVALLMGNAGYEDTFHRKSDPPLERRHMAINSVKATLLLAADTLQTAYPERIAYFPAYEIMMDELRDYRFYATDMLHPFGARC